MGSPNLVAAWIGILLGFLAGAVSGLFFHEEGWLGGYGAWPRRMVRLGHVSFFGIGFINLGYALSLRALALADPSPWPSRLLLVGAVAMPAVCYLSAWRKPLRHLFPIPVVSLVLAVLLFLREILAP